MAAAVSEVRAPSSPVDAGLAPKQAYEEVRERGARPRTPECDGDSRLEDVVLRAWEDLSVEGSATCLVCGGSTTPASACEGCGSELS